VLRKLCVSLTLVCVVDRAHAGSEVECDVPPSFVDKPPPVVETANLVEHVEEIIINRPLDVVIAEGNRTSLERTMHRTSSLPGVAGTHMLTGTWTQPGARRVTCLTDGGSTEEQVLVNVREGNTHHFRYEVWNYSTPKARPVSYAVGDFLETDLGDGRTRIHWTYSFQLRSNQFPGYLGAIGRALFRRFYLDTSYAELMRGALAVRKETAEQAPTPPDSGHL
jgi:hypothetical protein